MGTSAIILAGGCSSRFGLDKGLIQLGGKPLVSHVLNVAGKIANETILVVGCEENVDKYSELIDGRTRLVADRVGAQSPLAGALTGFEAAQGERSLLLPCDTPFVSKDILSLLVELCANMNACVPRWPNGHVEPLQAAYQTKPASEAAKGTLSSGKLNMQTMLNRLGCVRYVSTLVLKQLDPELRTFININSLVDLKKAERILRGVSSRTCTLNL